VIANVDRQTEHVAFHLLRCIGRNLLPSLCSLPLRPPKLSLHKAPHKCLTAFKSPTIITHTLSEDFGYLNLEDSDHEATDVRQVEWYRSFSDCFELFDYQCYGVRVLRLAKWSDKPWHPHYLLIRIPIRELCPPGSNACTLPILRRTNSTKRRVGPSLLSIQSLKRCWFSDSN
jgi:hypothetical protein